MEHEVRGYGFDGRLGSLVLERMSTRSKLDKLAAYFYIPVNENKEVQQAQYDVLDALDADTVSLEPQEPDRLHVSLLFIERIKDDDLEDFFNRLNPILPVAFQLEIVRTGTFPDSDEKPLVLHVAPHPALLRLQQELHDTAKSMGFPISVHSEPKYYSPHISLAYNYHPQDIKLPDLKAPFKIPIYSFVASRNDYQTVRTIFLPNFYNEEVMVTRPVFEEPTSAGTDSKRELDRRIEQMAAGDEPEAKLPKKVRIVYNPELKYEARQSRSREFVDIELGPAFWDIGDAATRAGALAFQFGNILADEMIKGPGGPHEWSRADAMLQAPPKEQEKGYRFVFAQNSLIWAASMVYASYVVNGPGEMQSRGYHDALRWIELAMEEYPDYDAENSPDFHSLITELGDAPPRGVYPEYLIGKGGPGSGHHGHRGRPGEVGGSLPSGMAKLPEKIIVVGGVDPMQVNDFHFTLNEFDYWMDTHPDIYTDPEGLRDRMNTVIRRNLQKAIMDFTEETGHVPRNVTFTDDPQVILDEYYNFSDMNEAQAAQVRKEVYWRLYNGAKASFIGLEEYPDNKKIIHLNMDVQPNEYNLALEFQGKPEGKIDPTTKEFYESVQHELGHWLALEARVRNIYEDSDNPTKNAFAPSDEWKNDNRFYDPSEWAHEYQADLIASLAIGDMGFRSRNRALTEAELADRDRLMAKIDERMAAKGQGVEKTRSAPRPVLVLIPWGDGTFEGILTTEDDLPEEERGKGVIGVVHRGGEGSGHHDHKGRPGEVGGSLPSGAAGAEVAEKGVPKHFKSKEFGERINATIENVQNALGPIPKRVLLITDDVDAAVRAVVEQDKAYDIETADPEDEKWGRAYEEEKWSDEYFQEQYDKLKGKISGRLSGGNISTRGGDKAVVFINEELTVGEFTYKASGGQTKTIVAEEDEPEYVTAHELTHAYLGTGDGYGAMESAHIDFLESNPELAGRLERALVPDSYAGVMGKYYPNDKGAMEKEFYTDMVSFGIRLENNPNENRIMIGGSRSLTTDDWWEGEEDPKELALHLLSAAREYVRKQEDNQNAGEE